MMTEKKIVRERIAIVIFLLFFIIIIPMVVRKEK